MRKHDELFTLRIIGGHLKGKSLYLTQQKGVRPTKSIIRESLFNRLGSDIMHVTFIELFAGSGSVGIEAYSRGAKKVYLIEQHVSALSLLRQNHDRLGLGQAVSVIAGDVFSTLPQIIKDQHNVIIYCDPPFPIREKMEAIYQQCFALLEKICIQEVKLLIFEMMSGVAMPTSIGNFKLDCSRKFGKTTLHYYVIS